MKGVGGDKGVKLGKLGEKTGGGGGCGVDEDRWTGSGR